MGVACLAALPGAVPLAGAFGLGHVVVLSTLGQPLSANIEITQITPDEAQSLRVGVAPDSLYEAQHLSYSDALQGATVLLRQDASGHSYLHLSGTRPVHEPFVDLLLRADWAHGELTRNYTLLLDPPGFREPGVASIAPQSAAPLARAVQRTLPAAPPPAGSRSGYTVQRGDTLFSIARSYAGGEVSLDQMLAAMYSANQGAFIDGDINRLRAGAVLKVPSAGQAQALSSSQAHQIIVAHSGDFGAYRRRLAGLSPTRSGGNARSMHGTVQARVQEPGSGASGPQSQLRLSQAGVAAPGQTAEANWIAAQKQAEALAAKLAAAKADVAALAKLAASASAAARAMQPGAAPAASAPQAASPASVAVAAASVPARPSASAPGAAPGAASAPGATASHAVPASAPLHTASAPPKPAPAHPEAKPGAKPHEPATESHGPGLFGGLLANPLLAPAGLLLGVLLAGWAVLRRRRASGGGQSSVFDSHMGGTDSFFGASGGERVDTNNSTLGSSMQYSPSQVESVDVDPVAEADVYLAYGRDLQAEEILKEALKNHPDRNAARLKLLEIYAKRKDARSFELTAAELFTRTDGSGEEWKKVQELGRGLDAANPLYHNTQPPMMGTSATTITGTDFDASQPASTEPAPTMPPTELLAGLPSLSGPEEPAGSGSALDLSLDLGGGGASPAPETPAAPAAEEPKDMGLDFDLSALTLPPAVEPAAPAAPSTAAEPAPLEFDLGLPPVSEPSAAPAQALDTRLALVEESRAMGDLDTARHLLHEIIAESDGETRAQAEKLLAQLG
ncbi:MAG: LysM peptidoglycan-binding domain-containing protein [Betaproteobacteria bacterium]|nr:LysM peptidoglycan-binding domain-containing protein [Betaproteobacteria bacterium]